MKELRGTGVAIVTPFRDDEIDFEALGRCVEHVIAGGVEYIVALGSTGESATQTSTEKRAVLSHVIEQVKGRLPVVAGNFGGNDTRRLCRYIDRFNFSGVTAILSSSPEYNKPTQEGIFQHYRQLAEHSPLPVIVYNVPGRTGSNITAETTVRLAGIPGICGIKEASGDMEQGKAIIEGTPDDFLVLSGDDPTVVDLLRYGGDGVISVIANALPRKFSDLVRAGLSGDWEQALEADKLLQEIHPLLYVEGNPAGIKGAMAHLGICATEVRLPLLPLSTGKMRELGEALDRIHQTMN